MSLQGAYNVNSATDYTPVLQAGNSSNRFGKRLGSEPVGVFSEAQMNTSPINGYNALAESTQDSSMPCDTYLGSEGKPVRRRIINPHARQQLSIF